jgi:3-oxoacyl-[acyl-carrier-protein] synthase III
MSNIANSLLQTWRDPGALSVLGMGRSLPGPAIATDELLARVNTNFDIDIHRRGLAIARRMNIKSRHLCRDLRERAETPRRHHSNPALAADALSQALSSARVQVNDLSYLISHTATPSQLIPPNASRVAESIGYDGPFLELRQACTGFANALIVAKGLIASQPSAVVGIVGSETGSVFFDPLRAADNDEQLINMMQMGDGAAACVVSGPRANTPRISHLYFGQIGRERAPGFQLARGGSDAPRAPSGLLEFEHDYAAVREAGPKLFRCGASAACELGIDIEQVDYLVPHQANGRIDELLASEFKRPRDRIFVNADRIGNTGSAAIWLAIYELSLRMRADEQALILGAEATKHMFGGFLYKHA